MHAWIQVHVWLYDLVHVWKSRKRPDSPLTESTTDSASLVQQMPESDGMLLITQHVPARYNTVALLIYGSDA